MYDNLRIASLFTGAVMTSDDPLSVGLIVYTNMSVMFIRGDLFK